MYDDPYVNPRETIARRTFRHAEAYPRLNFFAAQRAILEGRTICVFEREHRGRVMCIFLLASFASGSRPPPGHARRIVPGCASIAVPSPHCLAGPIECAHVRSGTDGECALKPSDRWTISLCRAHHAEQHRIGERAFEKLYELDLVALAQAFAARSPHRRLLVEQATAVKLRMRWQ